MALQPDLVLATSGVQEPIIASLERLKLIVVALDATDFAAWRGTSDWSASLTGNTAQCRQPRRRLPRPCRGRRPSRCLAAVASPQGSLPALGGSLDDRGTGTFIGQMIEAAGGSNMFGDVTTRFPRPSEEEVLARAPEVILSTYGDMNAGGRDTRPAVNVSAREQDWAQIPAVLIIASHSSTKT